MKRVRTVLAVASLMVIFSLIWSMTPTSPVSAEEGQPYMGGYFDYSYFNSFKVMCSTRFMANAGQIPVGNSLGSVTSVTAGGGTPSYFIYQNGISLFRDNNVFWFPQTWWLNQQYWSMDPYWVGTGDIIRYYLRTELRSWVLHYMIYIYDEWAWYNDQPDVVDAYMMAEDYQHLVGRTTYSGKKYKYFQWGVESPTRVTTTNWQVVHDTPCYHLAGTTWKYKNARVCRGSNSYITRQGTNGVRIGGLTYSGVNLYLTQTEEVIWKYTGSTVADETVLWSTSGTVADSHTVPYQEYYP